MNGWMIGLCLAIWYLVCQTMHAQVKFSNTMKLLRVLTESVAEASNLSAEEVGKLKGTMDTVQMKVKNDVLGGSVAWLVITAFLIMLLVRGHL